MRLAFLLILFSTLLYTISLPIRQDSLLDEIQNQLDQNEPKAAGKLFKSLSDIRPIFYPKRTGSLCIQVTIEQAKALAQNKSPDFPGAVRLIDELSEQCGEEFFSAVDATKIFESIQNSHLAWAASYCHKHAFHEGMEGFAQIVQTPGYTDSTIENAKKGEVWCVLGYVDNLMEYEDFDHAERELVRVLRLGIPRMHSVVLAKFHNLLLDEGNSLIKAKAFTTLFHRLKARKEQHSEFEEILSVVKRTEAQIEVAVFGEDLRINCRQWRSSSRTKAIRTTLESQIHPTIGKNVDIINGLKSTIKIIVRGPVSFEVTLKPGHKKTVYLKPGKYISALVPIDKGCQVVPHRFPWTVEQNFAHRLIAKVY